MRAISTSDFSRQSWDRSSVGKFHSFLLDIHLLSPFIWDQIMTWYLLAGGGIDYAEYVNLMYNLNGSILVFAVQFKKSLPPLCEVLNWDAVFLRGYYFDSCPVWRHPLNCNFNIEMHLVSNSLNEKKMFCNCFYMFISSFALTLMNSTGGRQLTQDFGI